MRVILKSGQATQIWWRVTTLPPAARNESTAGARQSTVFDTVFRPAKRGRIRQAARTISFARDGQAIAGSRTPSLTAEWILRMVRADPVTLIRTGHSRRRLSPVGGIAAVERLGRCESRDLDVAEKGRFRFAVACWLAPRDVVGCPRLGWKAEA